jgi:uncharacterized membrane protein SpoIIM required for sporulation/ABC-type transport system involved in multi-copper enzyme maturation permease subunit
MKEKIYDVWLISKRELRDQMRDWRILAPLLILTIGFPFLMDAFAYATVNFVNQYGGTLLVDRLIPFSVLIIGFFPLTISLLGALESFVGEKERGTIEPLLGSPLADWQLYLGKLIVGIVMPLVSSFTSITIYLVMVSRQDLNMPEATVFAQLFLLTIAHALLMVSAAILFSISSTSVKAANLLASFIIIPVAMLMMGESFLLFWANNEVLWLAVLAVTIMAGLLVRLGLAHFQREYLLGREIDMLNLRWMWKTFWGYFKGEATSLREWFSVTLRIALGKLARPMFALLLIGLSSAVIGYLWAANALPKTYTIEERTEKVEQLRQRLADNNLESFSKTISAPTLFAHNVRSTLVIAFMGIFSFGVLGVIFYILNIGIVGVLLGMFKMIGYSPWPLLLAGIAPHGIFEIPALMLSCAAVMHIGLILVTPQTRKTVGEVLIEGIADWTKITLGVVVPLLAVAAMIEVYVTPQLLSQFVK